MSQLVNLKFIGVAKLKLKALIVFMLLILRIVKYTNKNI